MQQEIIQGFRLSPQQKQLWLLQQADRSPVYRAQCAVLIEGNLETEILKEALQRVVDQHEILRTTFRCLPGMTIPVQVVTDSNISWRSLRLGDAPLEAQTTEIEELFREEGRLPFDFEQGSPLRASLITLSPDRHVLLVSLPALCADALTLKNLVREISRSYLASFQGESVSEEALQYVQFSEWQNELLEAEDENAESGKEYWRWRDISSIPALALPFEVKPTNQITFEPDTLSSTMDHQVIAKVETIARKYDASTAAFLLACWQALLWRLTGQPDIVVSNVCDGREYEELHTALGLFAKSLPILCRFEGSLRFSEILAQTHQSTRDAYDWQAYFMWEQNETAGSVPDFPVGFEFEERALEDTAAGASFSVYKQYTCIDRFKIKLSCVRAGDSLTTEFHYDPESFQPEGVNHIARHFEALVKSAVQDPESPVGELEILGAADRHQLLVAFNQTGADYPRDKCIHHLFEERVEQVPDASAVVFEEERLTYQELNRQANQLAHYLKKRGVGPDVPVGICMERSLEIMVAILGILKAGGAYVPLDPALPKERLAFMLEDTRAPVLLTQQRLVESLPRNGARVVCLDADWKEIASESAENTISGASSKNLIYLIFTSGSTGKSKGVAVEHRQLVSYVSSILEKLDLPKGANFATVSTFAADLGNTVIFPSLCTGGCLHVVSQERVADPDALADYFRRHPIDCLKIVPSHLTALLLSADAEQILPRQRLILGGEASSWELVERLQALAPGCLIFNHYGPTEATVGVLTYRVDKGRANRHSATLPLGRPIANTQIYLLDQHLQPVPIGVPGELHIGGDSLARGYLNRPELTAEKFIRNPFSDEPGARLYKTGDLARYLPDGNIEFLGRTDHQVKIRGFRVELGEIEAVLAGHPGVRESVVLAREDTPGDRRLAAYVVPGQRPAPTISELRSFLQEKLPDFMVPSAFVMLQALPLTPNGKVDRHVLPAPDQARREPEKDFVAPRTATEEKLAEIWAKILMLERVGVHDNFFELGGDSILSIQIIAKANQAGLRLTPKLLFQHQTVAELAAVAGTTPLIHAQQDVVIGSIPLTPIQHRFFELNRPEPYHYNQAVMLELRQALDASLLERAVDHLLVHHDALRLRFLGEGSDWRQVNANLEQNPVFSRIDFSALPGAEQRRTIEAAAAEVQASLNLSVGPLVRVTLFDLGPEKSGRLLIVIHHLAVDGVSWRVLLEDLQTAYRQLSQGEAVELPPKTTSFKQWAERLREHAQAGALQQESAYWLAEQRTRVSRLPVDYAEGLNTAASVRTVSTSLSMKETRALLQEVPAAYRTQINDVLLTALVQASAEWSGARSLLVDLEGHGREEIVESADLSRTVGWFTTIFPVLLNLGRASDPGEQLRSVKEQLRGIPHRGIGYGLLRYLSGNAGIGESLRALPQPEIKFNYMGQLDQVQPKESLFGLAKESTGPGSSLKGTRRYLLDVNATIVGGQLQVDWSYSKNVHRQTRVEELAWGYVRALRSLIAHCQSPGAGGYTPSDFPNAKLSQKDLDKLIARIG